MQVEEAREDTPGCGFWAKTGLIGNLPETTAV